ncbi:MAG: DNA polymerase III subunit beta, partial [Ottowia sp.]|nr:DNA polymerase III subunit beta [Ottowia sp.]
VLANVLLRRQGAVTELVTSDLEVQLQTTADLGGDEADFATTVGANKLKDILRTLPADMTVSLEARADSRLILKAGKSRFTLQMLPADDFPQVQQAQGVSERFRVPQKIFKKLLDQVSFAMAHNDVRYYLNGILFVAEGKQLSLVSTDGHRLAFGSAELDIEVPHQEVILPSKTVGQLQRLLPDAASQPDSTDAPMIEMHFAANQARFVFGKITLITKLVEGKFPDYTRVIPKDIVYNITLGRAPLLAGLQRAQLFANEKLRGVRLVFTPGNLRIAASNAEQEEAIDEIDIDYVGDAVEISFNVGYLTDALTALSQHEMVTIGIKDAGSSAMLTVPEDANFKYVVMPMRL